MCESKKFARADFEFCGLLGEGSYARVLEAQELKSHQRYAVKVLDKSHILRHNKQVYVMNEKAILSRVDHPGIVHLFGTFQDSQSLYFVLELASGGELFQQIRRLKRCPENLAAFYCAEILLILEYLHGQKIIHRDLKPENLLLSQDGHIRLIDFGSAKIIDADDTVKDTSNRRNSFVGTAEYLPPELLNNGDVSFGADWWSFGCVIYQLLSGRPPFKGETEYLTFQKIIEHKIVFDDHLSTAAISLLTKLLNVDPQDRVSGGFDRLKQHPFFRDIAFDDLFNSEVPSYFVDVNSNEPQQEADAAIILPNSDSVNSMALANADSDCSGFLTNSEVALMLGIITERKGLFFKKKMLILTSAPRLFHISLGKKQQQTEIPWSASLRASIYKGNAFLIYTPEKLFRFQTVDLTAQAWVDAIEEAHKRGS